MKYKCLIIDHDDTVVNSTATIHYPCFIQYLTERLPELADKYTLSDYFRKNFDPGVVEFFRDEIGLSAEEMAEEEKYWADYVENHIPEAYPGMKKILRKFKREGGFIAVCSHSYKKYIKRDYLTNKLPRPNVIYGWDLSPEKRKPSPYCVLYTMQKYGFSREEILVLDDLKPGFEMARVCGVDFAAAGWAYDVPEIENYMRMHGNYYLKTVDELEELLFGVNPKKRKKKRAPKNDSESNTQKAEKD